MDNPSEVRRPAPISAAGAIAEQVQTKEISRDISFIENAPDKQVILSPRLVQLASHVGGCQIDDLLALLRRVIYETTLHKKY